MIFWALLRHYKDPTLTNFQRPRQILYELAKKGVFGQFMEKFGPKKLRFFGARSLSKLVYIDAKGSVTENGCIKRVQRGTLWVDRGSNPWGGGGGLNPSLIQCICFWGVVVFFFPKTEFKIAVETLFATCWATSYRCLRFEIIRLTMK